MDTCLCSEKVYDTDICSYICYSCGNITDSYTSTIDDRNRTFRYPLKENLISSYLKEYMDFDVRVSNYVNELFSQVTEVKKYRGDNRKSVAIACLAEAFRKFGQPKTIELLAYIYNVKGIMKGVRIVEEHLQKNHQTRCGISFMDPTNDILEIMSNWDCNPAVIEEIVRIYNDVKYRTAELNSAKTKSVAAGVIYYYFLKTNRNVSLKELEQLSGISSSTILKIYKSVSGLLSQERCML